MDEVYESYKKQIVMKTNELFDTSIITSDELISECYTVIHILEGYSWGEQYHANFYAVTSSKKVVRFKSFSSIYRNIL